jgi:hypothetical protein
MTCRPQLVLFLLLGACLLAAPPSFAAGQLELTVTDRDTGKPIAVRMHLKNTSGKPQRGGKTPFYQDHFVFDGKITLDLPRGGYSFEMERGLEYLTRTGNFEINEFASDSKAIDMKRFVDMSKEGWWSGDLDVHRPAADLPLLMEADDLHVVPLTTWWNAKVDNINRPGGKQLYEFGTDRVYHLLAGGDSRAGGTLLYFNLKAPLSLGDAKPEFPPTVELALKARQQPGAWIDAQRDFDWDLPVWVAAGAIDSIELCNRQQCRDSVLGNENGGKPRDKALFPDPMGNGRWSQEIYYHLLNCGLRIPPTAGSGSGVAPNPIGYNRVYVQIDGDFSYDKWWEGLKAGRSVVTNGPLIRPQVDGQYPGHVFRASAGDPIELEIGLTLSTRDKISYLEIVKNGRVFHSARLDEWAKQGGKLPKIKFDESGWFLIRAVCDLPKTYRHATTAPYYVEIADRPRISKTSVQFFLDWLSERTKQIKLTDAAQQEDVLKYHRAAGKFFEDLLTKANAE